MLWGSMMFGSGGYNPSVPSLFVLVDAFDGTTPETSPDGATWTVRMGAGVVNKGAIAWNGTIYCSMGVPGNSGSHGTAMTSPDGIIWTAQTAGISPVSGGEYLGLAWNGSVFCAIGGTSGAGGIPIVETSPDGVSWTARTIPSIPLGGGAFGHFQPVSIAWNGSVFCAVGNTVSSSTGLQTTDCVMTSPDGIIWTIGTMPINSSWISINWNGAVFLALAPQHAATSPDGITWTAQTGFATAIGGHSFEGALAWNGNVFCAVIYSTTIALTSPDGITWTTRTTSSNDLWTDMAWNGTVFCCIVTGRNSASAMTSPDGITWTDRTLAAAIPWGAII